MGLVKRQPAERRRRLTVDYPFIDCNGVHVTLDRRSSIDRRQSPADLEDLLILFSQLPISCRDYSKACTDNAITRPLLHYGCVA